LVSELTVFGDRKMINLKQAADMTDAEVSALMINLKHGDAIKGAKLSKACSLLTTRGMAKARGAAMARTSSEINDEADAKHAWARAEGYETAACHGSSIPLGISDLDYSQMVAKQLELESRAIKVEDRKLYLIEGEVFRAEAHGHAIRWTVIFRRVC